MNSNWQYYGIFFSEEVQQELLKRAQAETEKLTGSQIPQSYRIFCHHVTIVYNDGSPEKQEHAAKIESIVGQPFWVKINSIGFGNGVIAFGVSNIKTQNEHSHITIATAPGIKPVASNTIENWTKIDEFSVMGTLDVTMKRFKK